jgi:hypothetical protein
MLAVALGAREPELTIEHSTRPTGDKAISLLPLSVGFLSDGSEMYVVSMDATAGKWHIDHVSVNGKQVLQPLDGDLSPPVSTSSCDPAAAAYSRDLDAVAVAYRCGPIVLLPASPDSTDKPRVASAYELKDCYPSTIALSSTERHLAAVYTCVTTDTGSSDGVAKQYSKYKNWDVDKSKEQPEPIQTNVDLAFAKDNSITSLMFGADGHVTVGIDELGSISLHDVSATGAPILVQADMNQANPQQVWVSADGRDLAELDENTPGRIQVRSVDFWVGPIRVPSAVLVGREKTPMQVLLDHAN